MKKTNLIKVVLVMILSLMLILFSTNVLATDQYEDLTQTLGAGSNSANNANNAGNVANNANNANNDNNSNNVNNNNSSIYNNSNLPYTGISDSIPVMILLVVFAISAVFAYKKIKEYKNV